MRFRKKPVIIEAEQFRKDGPTPRGLCMMGCEGDAPHVHTMHGGQTVVVVDGDWIIPEPDGEHFYPVKDSVFQTTYERVL